jgi:nucleotide-binding universal stress UspA family protein
VKEDQKEVKTYKKILVPLDGSDLAECVLPHVESITKGCGVEEVVFLRVVEPFHQICDYEGCLSQETINSIDADSKATAESYLSQLIKRVRYDGVSIKPEVITGTPVESIADYAAKNSMDLIAIATHGRSGISRWSWGNVADRILRSSCVPILMVRSPGCVPEIAE